MRHSRPGPTKIDRYVTVTSQGKEYKARWETSHGMVTVRHPEFGEKTAHLGNSAGGGEEALARLLLRELIPLLDRDLHGS